MKIQIVVAGFNRAMSYTHKSVERKVVRPLRALTNQVLVTHFLSRSHEPINSTWSGEQQPGEYELPRGLHSDGVKTIEQSEVDEEIDSLQRQAFQVSPPPTERDATVVRNMLRFLYVLEQAEATIADDADFVFFTRPDLLFLDKIKVRESLDFISSLEGKRLGVSVPIWDSHPFPNDRYALMDRASVKSYFGRKRVFLEFLNSNQPFSSEALLGFALRDVELRRSLRARAQRVRAGGVRKKERYRGLR